MNLSLAEPTLCGHRPRGRPATVSLRPRPRSTRPQIQVTLPAMARRDAALQRRITAWHEAAHAVVAFRCGIRVDEVALCTTGPLEGYVQMLSAPLVSQWHTWDEPASRLTWSLVQRDTERHAMVRLAGPVAEAKLFGTPMRSHACESDLTSALRLCRLLEQYHGHLGNRGLLLPGIAPGDLAARLRRRTRHVLGYPPNWRAVRAVAEDLEAWSRLSGHDAADTVQWTRRIESQLPLLLPVPVRTGADRRARPARFRFRHRTLTFVRSPGVLQPVHVP